MLSKSSTAHTYWSSVGDAGHFVTVLSAVAFAGAVARFGGDANSTFFDAKWKREGFCVTNNEVPYWNSHDVCLYADVSLACVLFVIYKILSKTPGLELANKYIVPNVLGIIGHGIGHGAIGSAYRKNDTHVDELLGEGAKSFIARIREDSLALVLMKEEIPFLLFWFGLIYASMPQSSKTNIVMVSLLAQYGQHFMPTHFGFTYVQTILLLAFSLNQTSLPAKEKDFGYAMYSLVVSVPVTLVGWMESTQCSSFVQDKLYGHVVYDGYIAMAVISWYILCYANARNTGSQKQKVT